MQSQLKLYMTWQYEPAPDLDQPLAERLRRTQHLTGENMPKPPSTTLPALRRARVDFSSVRHFPDLPRRVNPSNLRSIKNDPHDADLVFEEESR